MENLIQYIIYGILIYYFFFGGKKKQPPVEQQEPDTPFPDDSEDKVYTKSRPERQSTYEPQTQDDILAEVEKILGLPKSGTSRAEVPGEQPTAKKPEYKSTPLPNVKTQKDFSIRREVISDPIKRLSHDEKVQSRYEKSFPSFNYDSESGKPELVANKLVTNLKKNIKNPENFREMFIFSEIIARPSFPRRRR